MHPQIRFWMIVFTSAAAGALLLLAVQWVWHTAGEIDSNPNRYGFKSQIKRRKSDAMHDILDEMVAGNLGRVHAAAKRMESYGEAIDWYVSSKSYDEYGEEFHQAVDDLIAASALKNIDEAKEAALRLEKSCIECHMLEAVTTPHK